MGYSEVLKSDHLLANEIHLASASIHRSSLQLLSLIDNLLYAADAIRTGHKAPKSEPVAVLPVIRGTLEKLHPSIEAKNIQVRLQNQGINPFILIHPERFQAAFHQLLDNAVKFSSAGGQVRIEIQSRDPMVEITLIDEGVGISQELLPQLFEAFRQSDGSFSRLHGGMGMGLFVARFLIESYGGTLTAESSGQGLGARFVISLPKASALTQTSSEVKPNEAREP